MEKKPTPVPQAGKAVVFKRRTPEESEIPDDADEKKAYDWIRMLDAEGYPPAFIMKGGVKYEFRNARLTPEGVEAEVRIVKNNKRG